MRTRHLPSIRQRGATPHSRRRPDVSRVRTAIVDQHATWIAVNPIQGCPKSCEYCFLNERGQTAVKPEHLSAPSTTLKLLLNSAFYEPSRPVALYTWTDVMALPASRKHLLALLDEFVRSGIPNPIVLITKCHVPDEVIEAISAARRRGTTVIVYLSYSGLDRSIERGVHHETLVENFSRLATADIPIVHYWRPAFPESAVVPTMERVLDLAANFAQCTVAAGLKVEEDAVARLSRLWPDLATTEGVTAAEGIYPRAFWEFIHRTWQRRPRYPLFHTNSCALAYVLRRAEAFGTYGSSVCRLRNHCPIVQRNRCHDADTDRQAPGEDQIRAALARRGLKDTTFRLSDDGRELALDAAAPTSATAALTQDLGIPVRTDRDSQDRYWNSGTVGALPLIVE